MTKTVFYVIPSPMEVFLFYSAAAKKVECGINNTN